jgi:hypothetical protein
LRHGNAMSIPFDRRGFYRAIDTDNRQSGYLEARTAWRRGELVRLRRGVYAGPVADADPQALHRRAALAALYAVRQPAVLSHDTAALFWGLPVLTMPTRVHITTGPGRAPAGVRGVTKHRVTLEGADIVEREGGVPVTSLERTLLDLLRTSTFEAGVVTMDAALASRAGRTDEAAGDALRDALNERIANSSSSPGTHIASSVLGFADARSESPGESLSRARMLQLGFVAPELQHEVREAGRLLGRVDFWWPSQRIVGEFDGAVKYGHLAGDAGGIAALVEEKTREDGIRRRVSGLARWGWRDALEGRGLAAALVSAGVPHRSSFAEHRRFV